MSWKITVIFISSLLVNGLFISGISLYSYKKGYFNKVSGKSTANVTYPEYLQLESLYELSPIQKSDIVFIGDSIIKNAYWSELLQKENVKNRGIGSDTTIGVLKRISTVTRGKPEKIFMMIGVNDLNIGRSVSETIETYEEIINTIKTESPQTKIILQSVLPVNPSIGNIKAKNNDIQKLNQGLVTLAKKYSAQYVDVQSVMVDKNGMLDSKYTSDGIHPNGEAYMKWIALLKGITL